jgi:hypothetical protein
VLGHELRRLRIQDLGHDRQARLGADPRQDLQALGPEPLERVRRGARLEGPAAVEVRARFPHAAADLESAGFRLDRAGAGRDGELLAAHRHAGDRDHGVLPLRLPRHELVGGRDGYDFRHTGQVFEGSAVDRAAVAGDADRRPLRSRNRMGLKPEALDGVDDAGDVLRRGRRIHHDEHRGAII